MGSEYEEEFCPHLFCLRHEATDECQLIREVTA